MWFILALASSVFAAATSILAKMGIANINSNLATAIRTSVVLVLSWGWFFSPAHSTGCGRSAAKAGYF